MSIEHRKEKIDKSAELDLVRIADDLGYRIFEMAQFRSAPSFPKDADIASMRDAINIHGQLLISEIQKNFLNIVANL